MTVPSSTSRVTATGTGSTATYPYTFKVFDQDHLVVLVKLIATGVETTLTLTTDYTVTGVGLVGGGNVVLVNASQAWLDGSGFLLSTYSITITRSMDFTQETAVTSQGSFLPEYLEKQFDRHEMEAQQVKDASDRALKLPVTEVGTSTNTTLPTAANRANLILAFDADGDPTTAALSSVGAAVTESFVTTSAASTLTNERVLTGTANQVTITDNGAGSTVVVSLPAAVTVTTLNCTTENSTTSNATTVNATDVNVTGSVKVIPAAAPGSPENGDIWSDSTRIALSTYTGGMKEYAVRCIYLQTGDVAVSNTASATTLMGSATFGTSTLAAAYLTTGKVLKFTAWGQYTITGTPSLAIGAWITAVGTMLVNPAVTTASNAYWRLEAYLMMNGTGASAASTAWGHLVCTNAAGATPVTSVLTNAPAGINTTVTNAIGLQATWSAGDPSNALNCEGIMIEVLG